MKSDNGDCSRNDQMNASQEIRPVSLDIDKLAPEL